METQKNSIKCCGWLGGKHKKFLVIVGGLVLLAIIMLSLATAGWKMHEKRNSVNGSIGYDNYTGMMGRNSKVYPVQVSQDTVDQFVLPADAAKSGEIAIVVNDLESAKKAVSEVATRDGGNVYATFISYTSGNLKNGSIVVQIPVENFDATFGALKNIGSRVIQESTRQIETRNVIYPMMTPATAAQGKVDANSANTKTTTSVSVPVPTSAPSIAVWPGQQQVQNKGYIKLVIADYGTTKPAGNLEGVSQNKKGLWVMLIGELLLLIILFVVLVLMLKRIFRNFRAIRQNKKTVHVVRQMPNTRSRVIKVQRKK
jgi:hypothetical protein